VLAAGARRLVSILVALSQLTFMTSETQHPEYFLGHSDPELKRLIEQSSFYGDLTEYTLRRAGLSAGMRVLDVGCGPGDVSFLAASIVGPTGHITGVDLSPDAIEAARGRQRATRLEHVTFEQGDITQLDRVGEFDAVIGRLVLIYLGDPLAGMRAFARYVKPGGLIYFQEFVRPSARSVPVVPLYDGMIDLIELAATTAKIDLYIGIRLAAIMREAGLPQPSMLGTQRIEGGEDSRAYKYVVDTVRSLLPILERTGKVDRAALDIDTLEARLRADVVRAGATVQLPVLNAAWTRTLARA
jgi:ubiquinone/menaquinone biosynthesis C-methylase UbiE